MASDAEMARFKTDGYFVKHGVMDLEQCALARAWLWSQNECPRLVREVPASWVGPFTYGEEERDDASNIRKHFRWHMTRPPPPGHPLSFAKLLGDRVYPAVQQLLGPGCTPPNGTHGVWVTLPYGAHPRSTARDAHECHFDGSLQSRGCIGVTGYIGERTLSEQYMLCTCRHADQYYLCVRAGVQTTCCRAVAGSQFCCAF